MKNRKMLASSLLAGALLSVGYVASKPTEVHALTDIECKRYSKSHENHIDSHYWEPGLFRKCAGRY